MAATRSFCLALLALLGVSGCDCSGPDTVAADGRVHDGGLGGAGGGSGSGGSGGIDGASEDGTGGSIGDSPGETAVDAAPPDGAADVLAGADSADAGETGDSGEVAEASPGACPIRPVIREGYTVFACSPVAQWEIYRPAAYQAARAGLDEMVTVLDQGYQAIQERLARPLALPLQVVVEEGECCGSFTGVDHFGFREGNVTDPVALGRTRGTVLGAVVNAAVAGVSRGWPADWWIDHGHFTALVVVDVLAEITTPEIAEAWAAGQNLSAEPVYLALDGLRRESGWPLFENFLALVAGDAMDWTAVGENPSAIRSNYVVAYLSAAAERNLGEAFRNAGVLGVDPQVVAAIVEARGRLIEADQAGQDTSANWAAFRVGDHAAATAGL